MNSKKRLVIAAFVFLICLVAGYVVTKKFKPSQSESSQVEAQEPQEMQKPEIIAHSMINDTIEHVGDTIHGEKELTDLQKKITKVDVVGSKDPGVDNKKQKNEKKKTERENGEEKPQKTEKDEPVRPLMTVSEFQEIINKNANDILTNKSVSDGIQIKMGKVHFSISEISNKLSNKEWESVSVVGNLEYDKKTGLITGATIQPRLPQPQKPLMTKSEFERMINNTNDNILEGMGNDKVSGQVKIKVSGNPSINSVSDVRENIETGTWNGVRVVRLESDPKTGKIIGATVEPK